MMYFLKVNTVFYPPNRLQADYVNVNCQRYHDIPVKSLRESDVSDQHLHEIMASVAVQCIKFLHKYNSNSF